MLSENKIQIDVNFYWKYYTYMFEFRQKRKKEKEKNEEKINMNRLNCWIEFILNRDCPSSEFPVKLSNGTVPKVGNKVVSASPTTLGKFGKEKEEISGSRDRKETLEKQQSCPEETNSLLVQPALPQGAKASERRASSPFQNGRTEVLIGDPEGTGPRSPRGSTSSAANDNNLLNPPNESDNPEPICRWVKPFQRSLIQKFLTRIKIHVTYMQN